MNILSIVFVLTVALNICLGFILQMSKVQVFPQDSVILPCNSSGFPTEELHWEAMGEDVISLHGGNITVGQGFEGRVFLLDPDLSEDLSLILTDVIFNDGGVYRCLWKGQKPICSVHVHVLKPLVFPVFAMVGEEVTLQCFGHISKNQAWEDLYIQWFKDNREVLRLSSGKIDVDVENSSMSLPSREDLSRGIFSLTIRSVRDLDQGVYHCWYKSADYEEPRIGLPESHTLTVLAVSSKESSTTDSILSVSNSSHIHTSRSVASTQSESSSPLSTQANVKRSETEPISTASAQTYAVTAEAVSSEVSSTTDSILSVSDSSHIHTSRSLASTQSESSSPLSTHVYVKRSETETISTASAQTYAETTKAVSSEVSSTTDLILSVSDSSHSHISRSVASTQSKSSSPVSTHVYVNRSETETISTASAQTYAETAKVSSTTDSILSVSDSSHINTSRSVSTLTAIASTQSESSSPVSTHAYVKRSETEPISTASAQTYAETAEAVSSVSSTTDLILSVSDSSYIQTSRSVASTQSESSSPVSIHVYETEPISTASAQTYTKTAEAVSSEVSSTTDLILSVSNSSHIHTSRSVASTQSESSSPLSTHAYLKRSETEPISTASAQTYAEVAEGRYGRLKIPSDEKIPWILIGLISGVLLITAGVLLSLMLFIRN